MTENPQTPDLTITRLSLDDFLQTYGDLIDEFCASLFEFHTTKTMQREFRKTCYNLAQSPTRSSAGTGLVICGFGSDEVFPSLQEFTVDGKLENMARVWQTRNENLNVEGEGPMILPFAQADIAHIFMEGILPEYVKAIETSLNDAVTLATNGIIDDYLDDDEGLVARELYKKKTSKIVGVFSERFDELRRNFFVQPVLRVLRGLPKEEMAVLAEALVETTGLRRRMDSTVETVGGPVDVALISKSDGFVWIKRKHYFDPELNPDFISRRNTVTGRT